MKSQKTITDVWVVHNPAMPKPRYFAGMDECGMPLMLPMCGEIRTYRRECDARSAIARIHDACGWDCVAVYIDRAEYGDADTAETVSAPSQPPAADWQKMCSFGRVKMLAAPDGTHYAVRGDSGGYELFDNVLIAWAAYCRTQYEVGRKRLEKGRENKC